MGLLLKYLFNPVVFLADHGDDVLENCATNVNLNCGSFHRKASIYVRELDWKAHWPPQPVENSPSPERLLMVESLSLSLPLSLSLANSV